jgi:hypothetical protein
MDDRSLKLNGHEITAAFSDPIWAEKLPPIMSCQQTASRLQLPIGTLSAYAAASPDTCFDV